LVELRDLAMRARVASRRLAIAGTDTKDAALAHVAAQLRQQAAAVSEANQMDLARGRESGLSEAMLDRLTMGPSGIESTARGAEHVTSLPDPVGRRGPWVRRPNGLRVGRQRLPLGVIALIYESRPNVTVDAAVLCVKSGNAVLLRGGKEASHTNRALTELLRRSMDAAGLPADAVQMVPPGSRDEIRELVSLTDLIDLAIPRGGEGLIRFVAEHARVPVVKHYKGVCHLYLDESCNAERAEALTLNGKVQRPGVCNALECLLVHEREAPTLLPRLESKLLEKGVELRACPRALRWLSHARPATEDDWGTEYLAKILAIKVVSSMDEALEHVSSYGSNHTEAICTEHQDRAERWLNCVDASCVLVNASTRFNDGGQLGLGAEIGISTTKLHAYGPMGLESLTTEKWIVLGNGQIRQ